MNASLPSQIVRGLDTVFQTYSGPPFSLRLWDGREWTPTPGRQPACTAVVANPEALTALLAQPNEVTLGEAFVRRDIDVEGDLFSVFAVAEHLFDQPMTLQQRALALLANAGLSLRRWTRHGAIHSRQRDKSSISYHYDQPVKFYRPWLGETIAYSCAYFNSPEDSLDTAQKQKIELICRKLRLEPGDHFLDVGCGWGSLILHAAGAHQAHARGVTLSKGQAAEAQRRIDAAGLGARCKVELTDYRDLKAEKGGFDKIASVGMFEHVGLPNLRPYFHTLRTLLRPGGVLMNHGIVRAHNAPRRNSSFIDKHVFPDGSLVTLAEVVEAAEAAGLEVRDVENLREHYDLTLQRWVAGLRAHEAAIREFVSDEIYRIWLLYMAGSAAAFRRGDIAVYQVLLSSPDRGHSKLPLTREDWLQPSELAGQFR